MASSRMLPGWLVRCACWRPTRPCVGGPWLLPVGGEYGRRCTPMVLFPRAEEKGAGDRRNRVEEGARMTLHRHLQFERREPLGVLVERRGHFIAHLSRQRLIQRLR